MATTLEELFAIVEAQRRTGLRYMMMETAGMTVVVGVNPVTLLTSAFLGFPGLAALYGVQFYKLL